MSFRQICSLGKSHKWALGVVAVLSLFSYTASATAPTAFLKKVPISLSASAQTVLGNETLSGFPVLVRLSTAISGFDYSDIAADHSDIAFGTDDGSTITPYPFEVVEWDPNGTSLVWVRVPSLAAATSFNFYYGNGGSVANTPSDTWTGYAGVWHMDETYDDSTASTGLSYDSTVNGLHATPTKGSSSGNLAQMVSSAGVVGNARVNSTSSVDKGNYLSVANYDSLALGSTFAVSGWFKTTSIAGSPRFWSRKAEYTDGNGWEVNNSSSVTAFTARGASSTAFKWNVTTAALNTWLHVAIVFNGTTLTAYANGVACGSGTIAAATDNSKPLSFGNTSSGNSKSLSGLYDEIRLLNATPSAAWFASEYATANDAGYFTYGAATALDASAPVFSGAPTVVGDNGSFTFSATLASGAGDLFMVFTDLATGVATTNPVAANVSTPGTYTATPSLVAGSTYDFAVLGVSPSGTKILKQGDSPVYAGEVTIVQTADADETMMAAGSFTVSRGASTLGDLAVNYTVGGTAVAGETYEALSGTVVISNGSSSATITVTPIYSDAVQSDVTVVATLAAGAYLVGTPDNATVTVVNGLTDPYVRYVSTTGNDANDGLALANAKATVAAAVAEFDGLEAGKTGTVYVAAGEYDIVPSGDSCFVLTGAVHVVGMTGNPEDVVLRRSSGTARIAMLNHAEAVVQYVTLANGNIKSGGNAYIDSNGGEILDCILTGGKNAAWDAHGAGAYLKAGRIARCRFLDNLQAAYGAGIYAEGGRVENCLVTGMTSGGGAVRMKGYSTLVNCTIAGNSASACSGVWLEEKNKPKVVNCAIFANKTSNSLTGFVYNDASYGNSFVNCASEIEIPNGVDCVVGQPVLRDAANGDFHLHPASCAIDAGTTGDAYTATSPTDLDGASRLVDAIDIGCYETSKTTPSCGFTLQASQYTVPAEVVLNGASLGTSGSETYAWTFANDTDGTSETTDPSSSPSHVWTATAPGSYTVTLTVTDGAETVTYTLPSALVLAPDTLYVLDANPGAAYPYDTEATAASNVATAVDAAADGSTILILPGATGVLKQTKQTVVEKGVRILGATGNPSDVVLSNDFAKINSDGCRIFILNHPDAFVGNLTMTQGSACANNAHGGNVFIKASGGTVSNCVIRSGRSRHFDSYGAAVFMYAGVLTHTEITGEFASYPAYNADPSGKGLVVHLNGSGARMENCLVHDISPVVVSDSVTCGSIVAASSGIVRNCTIVPNCQMPDWSSSDGNFKKYNGGSAIYAGSSATIANCVAATLLATNGLPVAFSGTAARYSNCAGDTGTVWAGTDCIDGTAAAFFKDYAHGDYTPRSPTNALDVVTLVNKGTNYEGMASVDLAGKPRLVGSKIDIGCYELPARMFAIIVR